MSDTPAASGRRLRILELRSVWGTGGGPEKTILLGAAQADQASFEVTVTYIRDLRDRVFTLDRRARDAGVDYVEVVERHSFDWKIWPQLTRLIRDRQIDIIHAHEHKTDVLAWFLARRTGAIPLSTAHGWSGMTARDRWLYYPMDKWMLARYPRVIAVSSRIKEELVRYGADPGRIEVILNAIDTSLFHRNPEERPAARQDLGLTGKEFVIGAVGRLERVKRFDLLIEAFAVFSGRHPQARLVIVGDGGLRADLTMQATRLGLNGRVMWLGHREDIPRLYQAFDLVVQSSETEGTPNAVLEAMATEVPLVATDVGGTRELARPDVDGLIVPKLDVGALVKGMANVIDGPEAARTRAISARTRVETDLSFRARTRRLEDVYRDLARSRKDGRG